MGFQEPNLKKLPTGCEPKNWPGYRPIYVKGWNAAMYAGKCPHKPNSKLEAWWKFGFAAALESGVQPVKGGAGQVPSPKVRLVFPSHQPPEEKRKGDWAIISQMPGKPWKLERALPKGPGLALDSANEILRRGMQKNRGFEVLMLPWCAWLLKQQEKPS
jgi:hypothetical protein